VTDVVEVKSLAKTFRVGVLARKVEAVRDVSFTVREGQSFGLLGPNGAGKTTTLKVLLGLIFPTKGEARLFGKPAGDREARTRLGYLPESPYVYPSLKPLELLDFVGRLFGLSGAERKKKGDELLERVGLTSARDRAIGKFSKGMMQRIGLAQALLTDAPLLVLDEPMSGLDPIGRKEVRDLLEGERKRGKTLIVTSHILTDVEAICDSVAILQSGKVVASGPLSTLLRRDVLRVDVELDGVGDALAEKLTGAKHDVRRTGTRAVVGVQGEEAVSGVLRDALDGGARVVAVTPFRETLEDLFVRNTVNAGD
jgi:ABC-2 type transport system ATP-binding protein